MRNEISAIQLRPYQRRAVNAALDDIRNGSNAVIIEAAVGAGKSFMIAAIAHRYCRLGEKVLVAHHNATLCQQNFEKFNLLRKEGEPHKASLLSAKLGVKDSSGDVIFATIGSLDLEEIQRLNIGLLMIDECHRVNSMRGQFYELCSLLSDIPLIGFSGTPWRLGEGLIYGQEESIFEKVSYKVGIEELVDKGFLSPLVLPEARVTQLDFSSLIPNSKTLDFDTIDLEEFYETQLGVIIPDMLEKSQGRRSIFIFCPSVKFCEKLNEGLKEVGVSSEIITGETPQFKREKIIQDVKDGATRIVVSVDTMTTGVDCPPVDCIIALRPTLSSALYVQMVGRGLRISPETNKEDCLLLDYANWMNEHGYPEDAKPPLSKEDIGLGINGKRRCNACSYLNLPNAKRCVSCGEPLGTPRITDIANLNKGFIFEIKKYELNRIQEGIEIILMNPESSPSYIKLFFSKKIKTNLEKEAMNALTFGLLEGRQKGRFVKSSRDDYARFIEWIEEEEEEFFFTQNGPLTFDEDKADEHKAIAMAPLENFSEEDSGSGRGDTADQRPDSDLTKEDERRDAFDKKKYDAVMHGLGKIFDEENYDPKEDELTPEVLEKSNKFLKGHGLYADEDGALFWLEGNDGDGAVDKADEKLESVEKAVRFTMVNPRVPFKTYTKRNGHYGVMSEIFCEGEKETLYFPLSCENKKEEKAARKSLALWKEGIISEKREAILKRNASGILEFVRFID
ncbi:DEAD/DEAH box helicase [Acetobacteraceae bacterium]|nr:DEAD/DEAH box helicase [Acetobacteraceae bacterium]